MLRLPLTIRIAIAIIQINHVIRKPAMISNRFLTTQTTILLEEEATFLCA
jgi:hypothetical protein